MQIMPTPHPVTSMADLVADPEPDDSMGDMLRCAVVSASVFVSPVSRDASRLRTRTPGTCDMPDDTPDPSSPSPDLRVVDSEPSWCFVLSCGLE